MDATSNDRPSHELFAPSSPSFVQTTVSEIERKHRASLTPMDLHTFSDEVRSSSFDKDSRPIMLSQPLTHQHSVKFTSRMNGSPHTSPRIARKHMNGSSPSPSSFVFASNSLESPPLLQSKEHHGKGVSARPQLIADLQIAIQPAVVAQDKVDSSDTVSSKTPPFPPQTPIEQQVLSKDISANHLRFLRSQEDSASEVDQFDSPALSTRSPRHVVNANEPDKPKSALSTPRAANGERIAKKRVTMHGGQETFFIRQDAVSSSPAVDIRREPSQDKAKENDKEIEKSPKSPRREIEIRLEHRRGSFSSSSERLQDAADKKSPLDRDAVAATAIETETVSQKKKKTSWVGKTLTRTFRRSKPSHKDSQRESACGLRGALSLSRSTSSADLSYENFDAFQKTKFHGNNSVFSLSSHSASNPQIRVFPSSQLNMSLDESILDPISASLKRSPLSSKSMYEKELLGMFSLSAAQTSSSFAAAGETTAVAATSSSRETARERETAAVRVEGLMEFRGPPVSDARNADDAVSVSLSLRERDANLDKISRLVVGVPYTHRASWGTGLSALAIAADKSFVASSGRYDSVIRTWDALTGREMNAYALEDRVHIHCLALAPDDSFAVAGCSDGRLYLFDLRTGDKAVLRRESPAAPHGAQPSAVWSVAVSPTQSFFVCGDGSRAVTVWELGAPFSGETLCVTLSDGQRERYAEFLAHNSEQDRRGSWRRHSRAFASAFSSHNAPSQPPQGALETRCLAPFVARRVFVESEELLDRRVTSLAVSLDGRRVVSTLAHIVSVWDVLTGERVHVIDKFSFEVRFAMSPDASCLATWGFGHALTLWREREEQEDRSVVWEEQLSLHCRAHCAALSQDGSLVLTGHGDGSCVLWDGLTGEQIKFYRPTAGERGAMRGAALVALSRDGAVLAAADSKTSSLRVWTTSIRDQITASAVRDALHVKRRIDPLFYVAQSVVRGRESERERHDAAPALSLTQSDSQSVSLTRSLSPTHTLSHDKSLSQASDESVAGSALSLSLSPAERHAQSLSLFAAQSDTRVASLSRHGVFPEDVKAVSADAQCAVVLTHRHRLLYWDLSRDELAPWKGFEDVLAMRCSVCVSPDQAAILVCGYFRKQQQEETQGENNSTGTGSEYASPANSFTANALFRNHHDETQYKVFLWKRDTAALCELYSCAQFFYHDDALLSLSCSYNAAKVVFWSPESGGCFLIAAPLSREKPAALLLPPPKSSGQSGTKGGQSGGFVLLHCWHAAMALNGTVCVLGSSSEAFFVWDVEMGEALAEFAVSPALVARLGAVSGARLAHDNTFFVLAHRTGFTVWDGTSGAQLAAVEIPAKYRHPRLSTNTHSANGMSPNNNISANKTSATTTTTTVATTSSTWISFVSIASSGDQIKVFLSDSTALSFRNIYSSHGMRLVNRDAHTPRELLAWLQDELKDAAQRRTRRRWAREEMHMFLLQSERFTVSEESEEREGESYESLLHFAVKHQHAAPFVRDVLLMFPHLALLRRRGWSGRERQRERVHDCRSLLRRAAQFDSKLCVKVVLDCLLALLSAPRDDHALQEQSERERQPFGESSGALAATPNAAAATFPAAAAAKQRVKQPTAFLGNSASFALQSAPHLGDLVDVRDLCYVARRSPELFLDFVCRLRCVPNYYFVAQCERYNMRGRHILRGSRARSPRDFWVAPRAPRQREKEDEKERERDDDEDDESCFERSYAHTVAYPVAAFIVPLRGVCGARSPFIPTLVEAARSTDHFEVFDNEVVKMVLEYKWNNTCLQRFKRDFALKIALFVLFSINAIVLDRYVEHDSPLWRVVCGCAILCAIVCISLHFVRHEVEQCRCHYKGFVAYFADLWNLINIASNALTLASVGIALYWMYLVKTRPEHLRDARDVERVEFYAHATHGIAAATFPLLGLEIMYFLGGIKSTGPIVRMIMEISKATRFFISILIITVFSFAGSFMLLFRGQTLGHGDAYYYNGFRNYSRTMLTVYTFFFGGYKIQDFEQASSPALAIFLLCVFLCFVLIILFNMLIAIMRDRYDEVKAVYSAHATFSLTKLVLEYESITKQSERLRHRDEWYPEWIQVLQRIDKVHDFSASESMMSKVNVIKQAIDDNLNRTDRVVAMIENTNHRRDALQQKVALLDESTQKELREINEKLDILYGLICKNLENKE